MKTKKDKICIIGYYGFGNFGDDLMLDLFLEKIQYKYFEVIVFTKRPYKRLKKNIKQVVLRSKFSVFQYIYYFFKCKLVLWGGGTCIYESFDGNDKGLNGLLRRVLLSKIFHCRFVFLGIGFDILQKQKNIQIAKNIFKKASSVYFRDAISYRNAKDYFKGGVLSSDLAFLYRNCEKLQKTKKQEPYRIVFCGVGDSRFLEESFLDKISELLKNIHYQKKAEILLIPLHKNKDEKLHFTLLKRLENDCKISLFEWDCPEDVIKEISKSHLVLGMRLHSLIISLIVGTPFFGIQYENKVRYFLESIPLKMPSFWHWADDFEKTSDVYNSIKEQALLSDQLLDYINIESKKIEQSILEIIQSL